MCVWRSWGEGGWRSGGWGWRRGEQMIKCFLCTFGKEVCSERKYFASFFLCRTDRFSERIIVQESKSVGMKDVDNDEMSTKCISVSVPLRYDQLMELRHNYIIIRATIDRILTITKTRLYNFDPLIPHFYIVKLGFLGVYIIFLISAQKHRMWVLVRTA